MRFHLGYILGLFAIALASAAGYISVIGWGKLFAGEATIVMIVMGIIEAAKIVTTIYLHRYGKKEPKPEGTNSISYFFKRLFSLKTYLVIGVMFTMFLTSVGIYGFMTGAYQETANKLEIHTGEVSILEGKRDIYKEKITDNKSLVESKSNRMNQLSDLRTQQEIRLDSLLVNHHWQNAKKTREDIETANLEIQKLNNDIDLIVAENGTFQDSVSSYQIQILELNSTSDIAAEIGPLKYVSSLTGYPMNSIINYIVLIIIFIFDPMAISLVLASNKVFDKNKKLREEKEKPDEPEDNSNNDSGGDWRPTPINPPMEEHIIHMNDKEVSIETLPSKAEEDSKAEALSEFIEDFGVQTNDVDEIIEPEPTEVTDEVEEEGDDSPIEDELIPVEEVTEEVTEEVIEEATEEATEEVTEEVIEEATEEATEEAIEEVVEEKPEDQIEENKEKLKEAIQKFEEIKPNPVITTGNVKREEIKEIKEGTRGYSVNVPEPKVEKIGTNKEVRDGENKIFYFNRPR